MLLTLQLLLWGNSDNINLGWFSLFLNYLSSIGLSCTFNYYLFRRLNLKHLFLCCFSILYLGKLSYLFLWLPEDVLIWVIAIMSENPIQSMHSKLSSIFILTDKFSYSRLWRHFEALLIRIGIDVSILNIDTVMIFLN